MKPVPYNYTATVLRVLDGDTIEVKLDLGFGINIDTLLRINRIDTPESHSLNPKEAVAAFIVKKFLENYLTGKTVLLQTIKYGDKYGRYLAEVFIDDQNVSDILLSKKYCKSYDGGTKSPWTDKELDAIKP